MKALFPHCYTTHSLRLHTSTTIACSIIKPRTLTRSTPARDRVIQFGRHKGKMMGTLPSTYLKWVSNNLRARDYEDWAKLADQVLADPVYRDRIEWEFAERVLNGDVSSPASRSDGGSVAELLDISQRFGWDNDDKVGWSRLDFGLLGTSKGGRIPRVSVSDERSISTEREVHGSNNNNNVIDNDGGGRRGERRERLRLKLKRGGNGTEKSMRCGGDSGGEVKNGSDGNDLGNQDRAVENRSPFPGRDSLLKKVLNHRKRL